MVAVSRKVEYSQHFKATPEEAFAWCTDYTPDDHSLMGRVKGRRRFTKLTEDTLLLDDTVYDGAKPVRKSKVVKLDLERLTYYNLHVTGASRNSLFFYQIVPDGDGESRLDYTGYEVWYPNKRPTERQLAELAEARSKTWHREWGNLAKAMEKDLRAKRG